MNVPSSPTRHLARLIFVAFLRTFIASRALVILIMIRRVPDLFLHLGGNACPSLELRNLSTLDRRGTSSFRKNE